MTQEKPHISRQTAVFLLGKAVGAAMRAESLLNATVVESGEAQAHAALANAYATIAAAMFREAAHMEQQEGL